MDSPARRHRDAEGRAGAGPRQGGRRRGDDRAPEPRDRQAQAPDLRTALGAHGAPPRPDGAGARRAGSGRHRGRDRRRARRRQDDERSPPFTRKRPSRQPFPEHLPRERVVVPAPTTCACCGGTRLRKLGETITETLEVIPRQWKVIQHVREKMTCRDCEKISEPPAPFHVTPRGWAGPNLLAMLLFEKFGQHQPLNRQAERYAREGVPLSLSTLADQVGAGCAALEPLLRRVEAPCPRRRAAARRRHHGAGAGQGQDRHRRCWVYVRDDRPFGGGAPPAAMFYYSRDRGGEHPRGASRPLVRPPAGRRLLRGYNQALCGRSHAGPDPGSGLLGACAPAVLRARRYRGQRPPQGRGQGAGADLAAGAGGRAAHRCRCSRSSAASTARAPRSAAPSARS